MEWRKLFKKRDIDLGRHYFYDERVFDLKKDHSIYSAMVEGSGNETYKTTIIADNGGEVLALKCTCPYYKQGNNCKHLAATLFEIEKKFSHEEDNSFKRIYPFTKNDDKYRFYDLSKITSNLEISDSLYSKAKRLIDDYYFDFHVYKTTKDGVYDAYLRGNGNFVSIEFDNNEALKMSCYCDECFNRRYENNYVCVYKTIDLIMLDEYLESHNLGDGTNSLGKKFLDILASDKRNSASSIANNNVKLMPILTYHYRKLYLTFKVGIDKMYVVKNNNDLINAYKNHEVLSLTNKASIDFKSNLFDDESLLLYNFMLKIIGQRNAIIEESDYATYFKNEIRLSGSLLDDFFDLVYKKEINYVYYDNYDKRKSTIIPNIKDVDINLKILPDIDDRGVFNGIKLSYDTYDTCAGDKFQYLVLEDGFYRLANEDSIVNSIYSLNNKDKSDIKIGRDNLSIFYNNYLPKLLRNNNVKLVDSEVIEEYVTPSPVFSFFLDTLDGLSFVKTKVNYKNTSYSLLDDNDKNKRDVLENDVLNVLKQYFTGVDLKNDELYIEDDNSLYNFLNEGISRLLEYGEVYSTDRFDSLKVKKKVSIKVGVSLSSDLLNLSFLSDLSQDELLSILSSYKQRKKYHRLKNGEFVDLDDENLKELYSLKEEMNISDEAFLKDDIKLPKFRALSLDNNSHLDIQRDNNFREFIDRFGKINVEDYMVPTSLKDILRPYQEYGFKWLNVLYDSGFGGILADEMGLGKTLQVISFLLFRKENKQNISTLIVTPASLVYNWYCEFEKFAPSIKVGLLAGNKKERSSMLVHKNEYDVLVTSYDLLKRDLDSYESLNFDLEVIDEAQYIKNQNTGASKTVKVINSNHRFALTGTPIENRLSELWSIFDYLMPSYLYSYDYFRKHFEMMIVSEKDEDTSNRLKALISPFVLRRRKADVLKDLPEKTERVYYANFNKEQKAIYDAQIMKISNLVDGQSERDFSRGKIAILAELMKTRQICCDPSLLYDDYHGGSAKKETCLELIKECIDGGHKMLLFSQFTSMLDLLIEELNKENINYYLITGSTSKQDRVDLCDKFNNDDTPVFLISLKAGGTGLNLTGADIVIHYDPWWNEAVISQASDRSHRIGQKKNVTVYKLICKNTIEEKILKLQEAKKNLADEILSGTNASLTSLSKEELLELLRG